jgi:hypothetical protein
MEWDSVTSPREMSRIVVEENENQTLVGRMFK